MRPLIFLSLLASAGCKSGTLGSGEWGTLRYFGELGGVVPVRATDDDLQEPLVLLPPTTDRDGNIYILHEQVTKDAVIYVGDPYLRTYGDYVVNLPNLTMIVTGQWIEAASGLAAQGPVATVVDYPLS